ncbi:MAG: MFS transporter [Pseudomonadota bacterium]
MEQPVAPGVDIAPTITPALTVVLAAAVGVIVFPLFAPQPLVGLIGPSLGLPPDAAGLVATLTLFGYATGLILLVPLTDLTENRRVVLLTLVGGVVALSAAAAAPSALLFLIAAFGIGACASAIQMIVPIAAALAPEAIRGRVIGNIMSGLTIGILLTRPIASLLAETLGWRGVYAFAAIAVAATGLSLHRALPQRRPLLRSSYGEIVKSLWRLLIEERILRMRAMLQGLCMGAFGLFWTAIALRLSTPPFSLGAKGVALFALAGVAGAIISPIAGRAGDRGQTRPATLISHLAIVGGFVLAGIAGAGWLGVDPAARPTLSLGLLAMAAVVLDAGVFADQTLGRRAVNILNPAARGRLNGLYTGLFFVGSAAGSGMTGIAWTYGGWTGVCLLGISFGATAFVLAILNRKLSS